MSKTTYIGQYPFHLRVLCLLNSTAMICVVFTLWVVMKVTGGRESAKQFRHEWIGKFGV